ncbi:cullin [Infirmifilum sp. NZ]|uniref:cullin n=1 Tax=Infirmifilum sp. NZ TaxID=2926850 RepID=UPI0027996D35|nr:cullin [Infirmifilum sp. NZ]UNQ73384.1 cullin [Infirmifilum sp. NZ]
MSESERIMQAINTMRAEIRELRGEVLTLERALTSYLERLVSISSAMSATLGNIHSRLEENRRDVAIRLIYLKAMLLSMEYLESSTKLKSMEEYLKYVEERLKEAESGFKEHYLEIMRAYLQTVDNVFDQFVSISQDEFRLMDMTLSLMEDIRSMYQLLEPEYVDKDIVRLAVETDISRRIESLEKIKAALSKAKEKLSEASTTYERVSGQLLRFAFKPVSVKERETVLFLPVTRVRVTFKGEREEPVVETFGPRLDENKPLSIEDRLVSYVSGRLEGFPLKVDTDKIKSKLSALMSEAKEPDEKGVIAKMVEGVR